MKNKNVTLADIARELGVSSNAVSLALRGKEGVSDTLRQQVMQTAAKLNYSRSDKPQGTIIALIPQRIAPLNNNMFYQQLCFEMETYARSLGYLLMICSISEAEEDALVPHPALEVLPCVGVISIGNLSRAYCKMISKLGFRYVMADQYYDDIPVRSVTTANSSGSYLLTQHLIDNGHQRIQFFGQARKTSSLADRWEGYKRAMRDNGLPILHNQFTDTASPNDKAEYLALKEALEALPELPTAFVCGHDMLAKYIADILGARGLTCPDDFSLVGYDNIQDPTFATLELTSYRTPRDIIAKTAVKMVLDNDSPIVARAQFFGEIIYRGSVKDIRR